MKIKISRDLAAVELLEQFNRCAARLAPGDLFTQDDLVQHMVICVLECSKPAATLGYYGMLGECRARDWLRLNRRRGQMDLKLIAVAKRERM